MHLNFLDRFSQYAPLTLRVGLAFVFIWFGWSGLTNPTMWVGLVPAWTAMFGSAYNLVLIHGAFELVLGLTLLFGFYTRLSATLLLISLLQTLTILGWGAVMVRDIGLTLALISIILAKPASKSPLIN